MRQKWGKNLLLIIPVVILTATLVFIDYTVQYIKDTVCTYIYLTNVESVKRFAQEVSQLNATESQAKEYHELYTQTIFIYNKTLGEKDSVVTFSATENNTLYHSNPHNEDYLAVFLNQEKNREKVFEAAAAQGSGEITMEYEDRSEIFYYHLFEGEASDYTLFLGLDRPKIEAKLNANQIILPICFIGLLLLTVIEYAIWLKMTHVPCAFPENDSGPAEENCEDES